MACLSASQRLILSALRDGQASEAFRSSLVITETATAPNGLTVEKLRTALKTTLGSGYSCLRVKYPLDGGTPEIVPLSKVDMNECVSGDAFKVPFELSVSQGRLFSVVLREKRAGHSRTSSKGAKTACLNVLSCGSGRPGAKASSTSHTIVLRMHSICADRISARAFLADLIQIAKRVSGAKGWWVPSAKGCGNAEALWAYAKRESDESKWGGDLDYWKGVMSDTAPVVQPNCDFSRPLEREGKNSVVSTKLSSEDVRRFVNFAEKITESKGDLALRAVLCSAFATVMYRRTLEEDLVIASELDGRGKADKGVFGPLSQQVYLRLCVEEKAAFPELVKTVFGRFSEAAAHIKVPYSVLVDKLLETGEKSSFRTVSSEAKAARARLPHDNRHAKLCFFMESSEYVPVNDCTSSAFEMAMRVTHIAGAGVKDRVFCALEYDPTLFHRHTARETLDQILQVLDQVVHQPPPPSLMHITLVTNHAELNLPDAKIDLDAGWPGDITSCFDQAASKYPDKIAIVYKEQKITYSTLQALVNEVAMSLIRANIKKGDVIGLYGHRSPAVVWAIMGILKAGAAYTMMDPKYPTSRVKLCLRIAGIKAFIHLEAAGKLAPELLSDLKERKPALLLRAALPAAASPAAVREALKSLASSSSMSGGVPPSILPHDVAVVTFTSGSTGTPKGVMGRHGSLTHFYNWMQTRFGITDADRFSMCSGIAHDPLQRDIFTPLYFGAAIHIPTDMDIAEPGKLAQWTKKHEITISCFTPAMGQLLVSGDKKSAPRLDSFRLAFFVGAMLVKRDVQMLRDIAPNVRVINMYGSTESQRAVGYLEIVSMADERQGEPKVLPSAASHATCKVNIQMCKEVIPVGIGMEDAQMLIINSAGQMAGIGEMAEIYVRSPHIALGYIGKEEVTRAKFLPNPFSEKQGIVSKLEGRRSDEEKKYGKLGDRMYKTGDLGRYRYDGFVECCGRADDQIKIRGFRVELGEINATLSQCPGLQDNIVIAVDDTVGSKMLVGYVVQQPQPGVPPPKPLERGAKPIVLSGDAADAFALASKKFLGKRLPHYMVPSFFIVLEALPLTANGKINTRALPPPDRDAGPQASAAKGDPAKHDKYGGKLTSTEEALVRSWSKVLKVHAPGLDEDFFELGGHSLTATHVTLAMREALPGVVIPIDLLFKHPTIAKLSKAIDNLASGDGASTEKKLDLEAEAKAVCKELLADVGDVVNEKGPLNTPLSEAENIVLTGATGFLGAFLCRELIRRTTNANIYCVARARSQEAVCVRVFTNLSNHKIALTSEEKARIKPVVGDLSKPYFGMDEGDFKALGKKTQAIVHNGAYVHWLLPYQRLKPTNVLGTHTVLQLASLGQKGLSPVHYVSTTSVFDDEFHSQQSAVMEDDPLTQSKGLNGGYPQSKWMAERLLMAAAKDRGMPVAIYRPGYVTGDCESGLWNTDDFQCRLIKGCIQLGCCPFESAKNSEGRLLGLDASPVDYVAEAIVGIAANAFPDSKILQAYHIVNPSPYPYHDMYKKVASFGYKLEAKPYQNWRQALLDAVSGEAGGSGEANPLAAVVGNFSANWHKNLPNPKYDMQNAEAKLKGSVSNIRFWSDSKDQTKRPIECPSIEGLVQVYLGYLIGCGFLEKPPKGVSGAVAVDWDKMGQNFAKLSRSNRT